MNTVSSVKELPYTPFFGHMPKEARAFLIELEEGTIGVMSSRMPLPEDPKQTELIHLSITKRSLSGRILAVLPEDIATVKECVQKKNVVWPEEYTTVKFTEGEFKGFGLHVWEK